MKSTIRKSTILSFSASGFPVLRFSVRVAAILLITLLLIAALGFQKIPLQAAPPVVTTRAVVTTKPWHILPIRQRFARAYDTPSLLAFSPDGKTLASGGENCKLEFWDVRSGREKPGLPRQLDSTYEIGYSPDGRLFATGTALLVGVQLWDARSRKLVRTLKEPYPAAKGAHVFDFAFSPDGRTLAASVWSGLQLWDVATGKLLYKFNGARKQYSTAFSPDGHTLATALVVKASNGVKPVRVLLWDVRHRKLRRSIPNAGWPITFSPDGRQLITRMTGKNDDLIGQWSLSTGALLRRSKEKITANGDAHPIAISPDGHWIATGHADKTVRLRSTRSGRLVQTLRAGDDMILSVAFSPDGSVLATGSANAQARLWRVRK